MKFYMSNSVFIGNIDPFLAAYDTDDSKKLEILTHDKWVSAHPVVLAMVAARGLRVGSGKVTFDNITARSGHYLERMGLFKMLGLDPKFSISEHDPSGRFIPLTKVKTTDDMSRFMTDMIPLLHLQPEQAAPIRYIVSELIRNVLEHAQSPDGAIIAAQYHAKSNMIRLGIADTGIGIRETIGNAHFAPSDMAAIKLALTPGITGTTSREGGTDYNAGAGLFFIKSIATVNRNFFMIYSGDALYKLLKRPSNTKRISLYADPSLDRHSEKVSLPYWQGTVVGIDISLDATNEFASLLDLVHTTYTDAVQERRKAKYKKARFV